MTGPVSRRPENACLAILPVKRGGAVKVVSYLCWGERNHLSPHWNPHLNEQDCWVRDHPDRIAGNLKDQMEEVSHRQ